MLAIEVPKGHTLTKLLAMKNTAATIFTILSFILILDSMNAGHAVTMFLLAGIVPGTNITLSAATMLQGFAVILGFMAARGTTQLVLAIARLRRQRHTLPA